MSRYPPPYGFPLRRDGECTDKEVECGHYWDDFYSCCRQNTYCSTSRGQIICCPIDTDCSAEVTEHPHCANDVWDLYHDKDQYWCCEQGLIGYFDNKANGFGCVDGKPNGTDVTLATPISNDQTPSSTTIITATVTPQSDPDNDSASPSSSASTGVIAGSTVGSVACFTLILTCIWFLVRRRKQQASSAELEATPMKQPVPIAELHSDVARAELDSGAAAAHELPAR